MDRFAAVGTAAAAFALALPAMASAAPPAPQFLNIDSAYTTETLNCKLFLPEGTGPWPAVLVMHGSGGLWKNDNVAGGIMNDHFEEYAVLLRDAGYVTLFMDSYTPRGVVEFAGRRPAEDPLLDDAVCSPRTVRPQDAHSARIYLRSRPDVLPDRIGILSFSQGAESALVAATSPSITTFKTTWTVRRRLLNSTDVDYAQPAPPTAPDAENFRTVVAYYPGCGFYSYFGSPSATASQLYMPACPALVLHGDGDSLYSGNLYPLALRDKSQSHANFISLPTFEYPFLNPDTTRQTGNNRFYHILYPGVGHSFNELDSGDTGYDKKLEARARTLEWLDFYLKPAPARVTAWLSVTE